jgi:hypothetical protein
MHKIRNITLSELKEEFETFLNKILPQEEVVYDYLIELLKNYKLKLNQNKKRIS